MALIPGTRYPAQTDADADYPHGKARNAGSYQDGTGTPLEKDWLNDDWGFKQALLAAASITPSGDPDKVGASQYLDAIRAVAVDSTVLRNLRRALALREVNLAGITLPSGSLVGSAVSSADGVDILLAKGGTNGAFTLSDSPLIDGGSVATVTGLSEVDQLIRGSSRILAIGDGGTHNAFSTTGGASWTAGGASGLGVAPSFGVWDGTQFVISTTNGQSAHSTNGVAWSGATGGSEISTVLDLASSGGLAVLENGDVIAAGKLVDGTQAFAVSSDHGQTWVLAGSIPSSDYVVAGFVAGNGGSEIYWLGKPDGIDRLDLWVSTDGAAWTKRAELPGFTSLFSPRLLMCQDTGLLLAAHDDGTSVSVSASIDGGRTWTERVHYYLSQLAQLALAGGRVFGFQSTRIYASDRL